MVNPYRAAKVGLDIFNAAGEQRGILCTIDTGFTGYLTLPLTIIQGLELPSIGQRSVTLADGSRTFLEVFVVSILWDGTLTEVIVLSGGEDSLIGMSLLQGYNLSVDVVDGGKVILQRLNP